MKLKRVIEALRRLAEPAELPPRRPAREIDLAVRRAEAARRRREYSR